MCTPFSIRPSLSFGGDCVLIAVYIINRLPNAALKFEVTSKKLTGERVDYDFEIFGRLAMAYYIIYNYYYYY